MPCPQNRCFIEHTFNLVPQMNTSLPKRKSPRAHWLEYNEGMYFITVCTHAHRQILGKVRDGVMSLSRLGEFLDTCLKNVSLHQANVEVIQYVIMPNHFHAIVDIRQKDALANEADTACRVPTREERAENRIRCERLPLLSTFVGSLKSAVSRYAHTMMSGAVWQPRYHDHAIRGVEDGNNISLYIDNNVANWEKDCFYRIEE